ncbi:MAG: DUF2092 domain-containing protein [Tepidisphaeraceae bacterium]
MDHFKGFLVAMLAVCACAAAPRAPMHDIDPKADAVLRKMSGTLAAVKQFSYTASATTDQTLDNGQKVQLAKTVKVIVRRPDCIASSIVGDEENLQFMYCKKSVGLTNLRENCYAVAAVPDNIDAMFDTLAEKYGITTPLSDLMFSDPYAVLTERVRTGAYLGLHYVGETKCHHLAFRQEAVDWQIWIEDSEKALPRKVVITYKEVPGHPQFVAVLDDWNLDPQVSDSTFEFKPIPGCKQIELQTIRDSRAATPGANSKP